MKTNTVVTFTQGNESGPGFGHGHGNPPWEEVGPGHGHGHGNPPWDGCVPTVPEPSTWALVIIGVAFLLLCKWRNGFKARNVRVNVHDLY